MITDSEADGRSESAGLPSEHALLSAIAASGYPLQIDVAEQLASHFKINHEWSYEDRDSGDLRALDALCSMELFESPSTYRVYPSLDLLIECKHTISPYIFFIPAGRASRAEFPLFTGLRQNRIETYAGSQQAFGSVSLSDVVFPKGHPFLEHDVFCYTFSKVVRRGKGWELSGSDAFQRVIQPLKKATLHLEKSRKPRDTFMFFTLGITIPIAVIDGPLFSYERERVTEQTWVRVFMHEHVAVDDGPAYGRRLAIDVV